MSDKDKKSKTGDTARKIWLAGIGAYGRAFSEVQEGLSKATKGSSKVFEELVQKGEQLETIVTHKSKETIEKMSDGLDLDERIAKMRARLKRGGHDAHDNDDLEERLERLEAKLDEVLALLKPKKRAPRKRVTAKKPAQTKKATSRKKPAAKPVKK